MKLFLLLAVFFCMNTGFSQQNDSRYYELRIYYCHPGKLKALIDRFANHTTRLFEKSGMENIGYWLPTNNTDSALYYVLAYPSKEARETSWKAFNADPQWQAARTRSEEAGKIVAKVTSVFMNTADISPLIKPSAASSDRSFELRTYYLIPGQMDNLLTRFKNHSLRLLSKHGAQHIAYWRTVEQETKPLRLVYMLAFPDETSGKKTWENFRSDPDWIKAKAASEKDHAIVEKVESVFLKPLAFSKIK
jgi:hypothetical protein